ncbi:MAG: phenylacetate-CoA oxygenase subunit PaaJ [Planctomycetes bacterium]|nr:phenylacetate-CoA oxygenase subunit PaaJ [Planctomycetota bacterium]
MPARTTEDAWAVIATVLDPELPALTIVDLGIVRSVAVADGGVRVAITPTFTACPAMRVIERDVAAKLRAAGFSPVTVETVLAPAWTSDWMSDAARAKLKAYGIAPPGRLSALTASRSGSPWLERDRAVPCPRCDSADTESISDFGSTPCKSLHRCRACAETFEHFKCH